MSSGAFVTSKYESTELSGEILLVRVQEETLALTIATVANAAPAGEVTIPLLASVSGNRKEYGVKCRKVTLEFTAGGPTGYTGDNITLPVLTEAAYAAYIPGATGTYLTKAVKVVSRSAETAK
jgi:hypothetical protein